MKTSYFISWSGDQIKMLAECERKMDEGEIPYVMLNDKRVAVDHRCMDYFGLVHGQAISITVFMEILNWLIVDIKAQIEEEEFLNSKES